MKNPIKKQKSIFDRKVKLTVDENLSELNVKDLAPKKIAAANRHLKKMKSLPK